MQKLLSIALFAALFINVSGSSAAPVMGKPVIIDEHEQVQNGPETVLAADLRQTASLTLTGSWTTTLGGPAYVVLLDLTTNQVVFPSTLLNQNQSPIVFPNLVWKHQYQLQVSDGNIVTDNEFVSY